MTKKVSVTLGKGVWRLASTIHLPTFPASSAQLLKALSRELVYRHRRTGPCPQRATSFSQTKDGGGCLGHSFVGPSCPARTGSPSSGSDWAVLPWETLSLGHVGLPPQMSLGVMPLALVNSHIKYVFLSQQTWFFRT